MNSPIETILALIIVFVLVPSILRGLWQIRAQEREYQQWVREWVAEQERRYE